MSKPSGTNNPNTFRSCSKKTRQRRRVGLVSVCQSHTAAVPLRRDCGDYSVGAHLFPFRTEKLSPTAPMVLPYRWESRSSPNTIARFIRTGLFCFKSRTDAWRRWNPTLQMQAITWQQLPNAGNCITTIHQ